MRVVIDIEASGLENPTNIWLVVCKDIDTGQLHIFKGDDKDKFIKFAEGVTLWVAHNGLGYDFPVLEQHGWLKIPSIETIIDTLIVSKLVDYSRKGHSIEDYGLELGIPKVYFKDYSKYSKELEEYCIRDVEITLSIYLKYTYIVKDKEWAKALSLEHSFQLIANSLHTKGFYFNKDKAGKLLFKVSKDLQGLDDAILKEFPPREVLIREFTPRATKHGTISKTSVPRSLWNNISDYAVDTTYRHTRMEAFNPSSHKQLIDVLSNSGWQPVDKTQTHIDTERELRRLRYSNERSASVDADAQYDILKAKLEKLTKSGWKINETNLATLPETAPLPARLLAKRILLEARRRTLTEWINLLWYEIRIEKEALGTLGIKGSGTAIRSGEISSEPRINDGALTTLKSLGPAIEKATSNILTDLRSKTLLEWLKSKGVDARFVKENSNSLWIIVTGQEQFEAFCAIAATEVLVGTNQKLLPYKITSTRVHGKFYGIGAWSGRMAHQNPNTANIPTDTKLHGAEMRALWQAPKNRLLVGVDAEGIQLRIFAHYINDPEFTKALVEGKKDDKSDPHSLNQRVLGAKSRNIAKRFIFAYLLGAGVGKLAQILEISEQSARDSLDRLLERYAGLALLKKTVIPTDAKRGYFRGLDGRLVKIPGDTAGERKHLCMSGYLQNGESIVMKSATLKWHDKLKKSDAILVNLVHDEWQTECPNDMEVAVRIAKMQADSLREVGEELGLLCPLAGSFWSDELKDYTIGTNWKVTH